MKSGGLGDFLFGLPAFNLLKNSRQESDIDLLPYASFLSHHKKDLDKKKITGLPWLSLVVKMCLIEIYCARNSSINL